MGPIAHPRGRTLRAGTRVRVSCAILSGMLACYAHVLTFDRDELERVAAGGSDAECEVTAAQLILALERRDDETQPVQHQAAHDLPAPLLS